MHKRPDAVTNQAVLAELLTNLVNAIDMDGSPEDTQEFLSLAYNRLKLLGIIDIASARAFTLTYPNKMQRSVY